MNIIKKNKNKNVASSLNVIFVSKDNQKNHFPGFKKHSKELQAYFTLQCLVSVHFCDKMMLSRNRSNSREK
jgi:hypothetical protein